MLMWFLGDFVNFTGENSHFLNPRLKCKHPSRGKNWRFAPPPYRFEMQIQGGSQSRICRWQITILDFLDAQLDFLAFLSTLPYIDTKYVILSDSSAFKICQIVTTLVYLSTSTAFFDLFLDGVIFDLKNSK